jgi:hypothetical protein
VHLWFSFRQYRPRQSPRIWRTARVGAEVGSDNSPEYTKDITIDDRGSLPERKRAHGSGDVQADMWKRQQITRI